MKKIFSIFLVVAMLAALAVPSFAAASPLVLVDFTTDAGKNSVNTASTTYSFTKGYLESTNTGFMVRSNAGTTPPAWTSAGIDLPDELFLKIKIKVAADHTPFNAKNQMAFRLYDEPGSDVTFWDPCFDAAPIFNGGTYNNKWVEVKCRDDCVRQRQNNGRAHFSAGRFCFRKNA